MSRYIDADNLQRHGNRGGVVYWRDIEAQPTVDVVPMDFHDRCMEIEIQKRMNMVEVVRCKDCKHRKKNTFCLHNMRYEDDNGFCSYGERVD